MNILKKTSGFSRRLATGLRSSTAKHPKKWGCTLVLLIVAITYDGFTGNLRGFVVRPDTRYPILTKCSSESGLFTDPLLIDPALIDPVHGEPIEEKWKDEYHNRVDRVVDEYIGSLEIDKSTIDCSALDPSQFNVAGSEMLNLASELEPWKKPSELLKLTKNDTSAVLLEYLREYECVMEERRQQVLYLSGKDKQAHEDETDNEELLWYQPLQGELAETVIIDAEIGDGKREKSGVARESLNRTLLYMKNLNPLMPVMVEAECLQRISLEARNAIALSAEAVSCMPRMTNAKDILRDDEPPS